MSIGALVTGRYPRAVYSVSLAQGPRSVGSAHGLMVLGQKTAAGSLAVNTPTRVDSKADALALAGPGSELHRTLISALSAARSKVPVYAVAVTPAVVGPVAATWPTTIAVATTIGADGLLSIDVATVQAKIPYYAADTLATIGARIAAAFTAVTGSQPFAPVTAAFLTPVLTFTAKNTGVSGNSIRIRIYDIPAGMTFTVTGAAHADQPMTVGAGVPDYVAAMASFVGTTRACYFVVPCTVDVDAAGPIRIADGIRDAIVAGADPGTGHLMSCITGCNHTEAVATTLAGHLDLGGTGYDEPGIRFGIVPGLLSFAEPWIQAANMAGACARETVVDRNKHWVTMGRSAVLESIPPPPNRTDWPTLTSKLALLGGGCMAVDHDDYGMTRLCRAQTCKHQTSGAADYRAADLNILLVTDYVAVDNTIGLQDEFGACSITNDVDGREPENLPKDTCTASLVAGASAARYEKKYCGTLGWCDEYGVDDVGEPFRVTDLVDSERDPIDSGKINLVQPVVVKRHMSGLDVRYEEVGV